MKNHPIFCQPQPKFFVTLAGLLLMSAFSANAQNPTVISDSLVVMQRLHAKEELVVEQDAIFKGEIHVIGESRFETDVKFDEGIKVTGTAKLEGNVFMNDLSNSSTPGSEDEIIIVMPNGQLKKAQLSDIWTSVSANPASLDYCTANGGIAQWWAGINKLFTACPEVKVGIRTNDPYHALHVAGVAYSQKSLVGNVSASTNAMVNGFSQNDSEDLIQLGIKIGGTTQVVRFKITNTGAIELNNSGSGTSLTINNGTGSAIKILSSSGANMFEILSDGSLVMKNQGTNPLFAMFSSNGTQILKLEDSGTLRSRHIKVDMNDWADHVFEKDYVLPSLSKVKDYIDENGHLPGVPSATEIKNDGLDIGTMQALQMQKIEELTLYLIELEARVKELEEENKNLRNEK